MQKEVLLSSAYLAPVVYYTQLYAYEKAYIERYDHYMKQTYRNRCVIASANGPLALTIPVCHRFGQRSAGSDDTDREGG